MFRERLKDDCLAIFDLPKVVFDDIGEDKEQDVLYINIFDVKENFRNGSAFFRVSGTLGTIGLTDKNKYGYLYDRIKQFAKKDKERILDRFKFWSKEKDLKFATMNNFYTKTEIKFAYSIMLEYDPAEDMRGAKLSFLDKLIIFFKDKLK